jgi:hypothetical protein
VIKHTFHGLRLAATSIAVAGLIAATAGPVAADTTPPGDASYSQNGRTAELYTSACTTDGDVTTCTDQQISAFVGKMTDSATGVSHTSQLCVSLSSYSYSESTGEYTDSQSFEAGCRTDLPAGAIKIDSKLKSAILAPTSVTVDDLACEKYGCEAGGSRDIVAVGSWTGFGPIQSSKYRDSYGEGTCRSHESFKGSSRSADAGGSLDGAAITGDISGGLYTGKYTFRSSCTEV